MSEDSFNTIYHFTSGKMKAETRKGIHVMRSIRYARSQRFQYPQAIEDSEEWIIPPAKIPVAPQNTFDFLDKMIQKTEIDDFEVEENNQFLSIYKPISSDSQKLPILVWIHGGSYEIGCGDLPTSDPSAMVKENEIIVVAVSYRLGFLGFLGGREERPANLGLLDIIEALKWIKKNAHNFGGDREKITLLGQSSGGDAIAHLMLVESAEEWFQKVIIQSAPLGLRLNRKKMVEQFLSRTEALVKIQDWEECLKHELKQRPSVVKFGLKAAMPYSVQYGEYPLCKESEAEKMWLSKAAKFDVLIGYNRDETAFYIKTQPLVQKYLKHTFARRLSERAVQWSTHKIYAHPAKDFAKLWKQGGGKIFLFELNSTVENNVLGAGHCFDLPLLFGDEKIWRGAGILQFLPWSYVEENGIKLRRVWASFVKGLNSFDGGSLPEVLKIQEL